MLAIGLGFGSTAITGFIWPIAELGRDNQRCHIGLKRRVTIVLLVVDVWLNVFLTLIFVYLISPSVRSMDISFLSFPASRFTMCLGNMCHRSKNKVDVDLHRSNPRVVHQMEHLLVKTLVGSIFIMVPTTANLTALCIFEGRELGWVCLTICVLDVTWQTCVFHWLTEGISEARQKASAGSRNSEVIQRSRTTHSPVLRPKKDPYSSSIISESSSGEDKEEAPGKTDLEGQVEQAPKLSSPEANTSSDDTHWKESNRTTLVTDSTCPSQLR